jgi:REP element-mobilizing transposase RayT
MSATKIDSVVAIRQFTLAVFYNASTEAWQFRILSPGGEVFGLSQPLWGSGMWSDSTFYSSVGGASSEAVKRYIDSQKRR